MNPIHPTRFLLTGAALALTVGAAALFPSHELSAATRPQAKAPARRGGASASTMRLGSFEFAAYQIEGQTLPTGVYRLTLSGNAVMTGQGRTITAQEMSVDLPRGASDISVGRASGNVRMMMNLAPNRGFSARGSSLIFRREANKIEVAGGVQVRSNLEGGGYVNATGNTAEVLLGPKNATLNGNVRLTLVKPNNLDGPLVLSGPKMFVDLNTGDWRLFGGRSKGNFNLKPPAGNP